MTRASPSYNRRGRHTTSRASAQPETTKAALVKLVNDALANPHKYEAVDVYMASQLQPFLEDIDDYESFMWTLSRFGTL